eukprot:CAMPEP_0174950476 /NCGR_PEP_ID=MMETSP1355-20121228/94193_1 /TAXON_ID=464990 /ORGANISM="Hemiselmis tepida, Strain CCMP443" /LENGTH=58 /DNA_ID=CAMNT_0016198085 /DNA_START=68 /DNA_END=241 /DNA_ORIENTATION=-
MPLPSLLRYPWCRGVLPANSLTTPGEANAALALALKMPLVRGGEVGVLSCASVTFRFP